MAVTSHVVAFLTLVTSVVGWKCAKYRHYFSQQPDYIDCLWDCCGNSFNRHCCAPIAIIVGCAICGAVVLAAIVVFLCCFWQRRRQHYGDTSNLFRYRKPMYHPPASSVVVQPAPYVAYGQKPPPDQFFQ